MWIKLYVYSLITALTIGYSHAQVDTEFWFVAPEVSSGHGDRPIYLIPMSQIAMRSFQLSKVIMAITILFFCIGIPIGYRAHTFYKDNFKK